MLIQMRSMLQTSRARDVGPTTLAKTLPASTPAGLQELPVRRALKLLGRHQAAEVQAQSLLQSAPGACPCSGDVCAMPAADDAALHGMCTRSKLEDANQLWAGIAIRLTCMEYEAGASPYFDPASCHHVGRSCQHFLSRPEPIHGIAAADSVSPDHNLHCSAGLLPS